MKAPTHAAGILHKPPQPGAEGFNQCWIAGSGNDLDGFRIDRFKAAVKAFVNIAIIFSADEALFDIKDHQVGNGCRFLARFLKVIDCFARRPHLQFGEATRRVELGLDGLAIGFGQLFGADGQQARCQKEFVVGVKFVELLEQRQQFRFFIGAQLLFELRPSWWFGRHKSILVDCD